MAIFFGKFRNKHIPVLDWNFVASLKVGKELFNQKSWDDWDNSWIPIAVTVLGDVVIFKDDAIYEIMHGTGEKPKPSLVTNEDMGQPLLYVESLGVF